MLDPFIALAVLGLSRLPLLRSGEDCDCPPVEWWAYALVLAQAAPLAVRRRQPFVAPLIAGLALLVYSFTNLPAPPVVYAALVGLYTVAAYATRQQTRAEQLERARTAESEAAVLAERNRIARELPTSWPTTSR